MGSKVTITFVDRTELIFEDPTRILQKPETYMLDMGIDRPAYLFPLANVLMVKEEEDGR